MTNTDHEHTIKIFLSGLLLLLATTVSASNLSVTPQTAAQRTPATQPDSQQQPGTPLSLNDNFFNSAPYNAQTWNPYEEIQRMQRDMDRMFNDAFNRFNNSPDFQHLFRESFTTPEMDLQEDNDKYTVIVNLPGSSKDNISVNLNGQTLTVKGEQKFEKQDKDSQGNIIFQERRSGSFQRSITLPGPVKQAGMKTRVDNGVLTVIIPKEV
jgi:HSP20 family protein